MQQRAAVRYCLFLLFLCDILNMAYCEAITEEDVASMVKTLLEPSESPSLQIVALRRDILRRILDVLERRDAEDELVEFKRSMSSLARWGNLPPKRNIQSLAKAGGYRSMDTEGSDKRSIANMAKNGQLPHYQSSTNDVGKRHSYFSPNQDYEETYFDDYYDKRNIGSLARSQHYPIYGKRYVGSLAKNNNIYRYANDKRNIASLARDGVNIGGKRNVAVLLRQNSYENEMNHLPNQGQTDPPPHQMTNDNSEEQHKRNLASIKAHYKRSVSSNRDGSGPGQVKSGHRMKRSIGDGSFYADSEEYAVPVYQNQNVYDYEELMKVLTGEYPDTEKRFLGSVVRTGWFRQPAGVTSRLRSVDKRHIGAIARLGWLPTLRSIRRFNRSGRSALKDCDCDRDGEDRPFAANGKTEDNYIPENTLPIDDKRYLRPFLDKIDMDKVFMQLPRSQ